MRQNVLVGWAVKEYPGGIARLVLVDLISVHPLFETFLQSTCPTLVPAGLVDNAMTHSLASVDEFLYYTFSEE